MTSNPHRTSRFVQNLPSPQGFGVAALPQSIRFNLLGGSPAPEALPAQAIAAATQHLLSQPDAARTVLNYSDVSGNFALRQWLAEREGVDASRILIVQGALHGISLVAQTLLDPGDVVVVEDPTYVLAVRTFQLGAARVESIDSGPAGLDIDRLRGALKQGLRPRIVYIIPDFQNPTGSVLANDVRTELVRLAEEFGFILLWDNPYRDSRFAGQQRDDVSTDSDHVVKVNTFSKSIGPGLRLGWLVLPQYLVDPILNIRRRTDQQSPTFVQAVVASLVQTPGLFEDILSRVRDLHEKRARALVESLTAHTDGALQFDAPEGGFFLWARIADPSLAAADLDEAAVRHGVAYVSGRQFYARPDSPGANAIRIGFTSSSESHLSQAAEAIGNAIRETRRTGRPALSPARSVRN